jgi:hypothetical protein
MLPLVCDEKWMRPSPVAVLFSACTSTPVVGTGADGGGQGSHEAPRVPLPSEFRSTFQITQVPTWPSMVYFSSGADVAGFPPGGFTTFVTAKKSPVRPAVA